MNQSQIAYQNLTSHDFTKLALKHAVEITQELQSNTIFEAEVEYKRAPDEYEFYLIEVGRSLSHLLGMSEQLIRSIFFLTSFSPTGLGKLIESSISLQKYAWFSTRCIDDI